ncbi:MAG: CDP-diacylglycerol--glycerol-3-phosphate 3-phosphatidyltransferase [Gammaproteobacteria bacterium AqS3]|nr:CDP-diacylglycerol--glycerol-3-phosphate 3-phosphatidyltransferase [Gammaproteobacteria bacterium AqS3]
MNLPVKLTLLRAAAVAPMIVLHYLELRPGGVSLAMLVFVAAGITDWFDGWLARRTGQMSELGAFLDPVADKILVVSALLLVVEQSSNAAVTLPAIVIALREMTIVAMREWSARNGYNKLLSVRGGGKIKTVVQIVAVAMLLQFYQEGSFMQQLSIFTLWAALGFSVLSWTAYLRIWLQHARGKLEKDG